MKRYGIWASLAGGVISLLLLVTAGFFLLWKNHLLEKLELGSSLATVPEGVIEYAKRGDGPPILVIHGSPGGYDQGLVYGDELSRRGFSILSVSRPGYLRTPLQTGLRPEDQADAIASLLTSLGITECGVLGLGEGAPCALQLAKRHPAQVTSLGLLSPLTSNLGNLPMASIGYQLFHDLTGDLGCFYFSILLAVDPHKAFESMMSIGSSLSPRRCNTLAGEALASRDQRLFLKGLAESIMPLFPREPGIINDNAQLKDLIPIKIGALKVPMLIIRGEDESHSPIQGTEKLVSLVPGSNLMVLPDVGFILPVGKGYVETWDKIALFFKNRANSPAPSDPAQKMELKNQDDAGLGVPIHDL
jgi:pimeloyl-ACP methyl ester carboxylesterase